MLKLVPQRPLLFRKMAISAGHNGEEFDSMVQRYVEIARRSEHADKISRVVTDLERLDLKETL